MKLIAWRSTGMNPCVNPPVFITIAPVEKNTWVFPWVLPLEAAREIFGHVVDTITEQPVTISLSLMIEPPF